MLAAKVLCCYLPGLIKLAVSTTSYSIAGRRSPDIILCFKRLSVFTPPEIRASEVQDGVVMDVGYSLHTLFFLLTVDITPFNKIKIKSINSCEIDFSFIPNLKKMKG